MQIKKLVQAVLPAAVLLPTLGANASHAEYFADPKPEQAPRPAMQVQERVIKLPWLVSKEKPIPDMSESSAVRMACGAADISVFSAARPVHVAKPVVVTQSAVVTGAIVKQSADSKQQRKQTAPNNIQSQSSPALQPVRTVQPLPIIP